MNDKRGSVWRKWDLHIHTSSSLVQHFGPNTDATWQKYISALEKLPSQIKVIGINDYIFIDGYRRVLLEKQNGRLANLDLILPVIELRLAKFGGTDSKLSRINFHIIFSDQVDPDVIEEQFLRALPSAYQLTPEYEQFKDEWKGLATRKSLTDLGTKIINSVPPSEQEKFGSPLLEGFNNINFDLGEIRDRLAKHYFDEMFVTAVGKTEWQDIKWNDKSIADKKDIINKSDFVFTSAESLTDFQKAKSSLTKAGVNDRLLDCSDAHDYADAEHKDRLGNCMTWIKADPTFEGLRMVVIEPEERIYVGSEPPILEEVRKSPTRYIQSIKISKSKDSKLEEKWFEASFDLNPGLVAIIGNRGDGKSALADIIGLLGNSHNYEYFSFLNDRKFLKQPEEKAAYFESTLTWASNNSETARLNDRPNSNKIEKVKYLPQDYFERICNELGDIEETDFDKELKEVIFSHVLRADRVGQPNLDDLIKYKTSEVYESISTARAKLKQINAEIVRLEAMTTGAYQVELQSRIDAKKAELTAHDDGRPEEVSPPDEGDKTALDALTVLQEQKASIKEKLDATELSLERLMDKIGRADKLSTKLENLEADVEAFREDIKDALELLGIEIDLILSVTIDTTELENKLKSLRKEEEVLRKQLDDDVDKSLAREVKDLDRKIEEQRELLKKEHKEYEHYIEELQDWEQKRKGIVGSPQAPGTLAHYEEQLERLKGIPDELTELRRQRRAKARGIYRKIKQIRNILADLYEPIQGFFDDHREISDMLNLRFDVSIVNSGFQDRFFEWISRSVKGSFIGAKKGREVLDALIEAHDFNNESSTLDFADRVVERLVFNHAADDKPAVVITDQLKKGKDVESLYDFIYSFGYLSPRYVLKLGSKELNQLSPGQRGALLIVFYLLIDRDQRPLIIDQPEHNLDNETVTELLVPAIREAKSRRQLVLVTHNPILAVVCNADQVICASLDIENNYALEYSPGAIEHPKVNRRIVDVLEGTMYAFENRQKKYLRAFFRKPVED